MKPYAGKIIDRVNAATAVKFYLNAFSTVFIAINSFLGCSTRAINS